jgi:hypothetical protein
MDDPAVQQLAEAFARTIQHDRVCRLSNCSYQLQIVGFTEAWN